MDTQEQANELRDKHLRRLMLMVLYEAQVSPTGGINGRALMYQVTAMLFGGPGFENDDHALRLARELKAAGLAEESNVGRRRQDQRVTPDFRAYQITEAGILLWKQERPRHPLIEDDRAED